MRYGIQTWSEESLLQVYDDGDLHGGQKSSEVKCGKLGRCCGYQTLSEESLMQVYDDDYLLGGKRSSDVK